MMNDELLHEWKLAKQTCKKIIQISIQANIYKQTSQKQSPQQFMKVYDVVYRLCSNVETEENRTVMVYRDYQQILKSSLMTMSKQLIHERQIFKLQMLRKVYDAYQDILKRLKHMFAYLNRPYHIKEGKIQDLDKTGMTLIVGTLFTQQNLLEYDTIYFKQIAKIRKSKDLTDSNILKQYVEILYRFHLRLAKKQNKKPRTLYTDFQQKYLTECKDYYVHLFTRLQELSPSQYFIEVNNLYQFEKRITEQCFGTSSQNFINKIFSMQFLEEYRHKLIQSDRGLKYILQNKESQVLEVITNLYKRLTNSIAGFKQPFESFVYEQMVALLIQTQQQLAIKKNQSTYLIFVQKLIKKNNELVEILQSTFIKFPQFLGYYKAGIQNAFAKNHLQIPVEEMLATYIDVKFKIAYSSQDIKKQDIRNVKNIFECLQNKDLFLIKYLQKLCKKIISITDESVQNHQSMIYHLKLHSGNKIAERLQKIIDEYKLSLQKQKQFKEIQQLFKPKLPYYMTLYIFGQSDWPFPEFIEFKSQQLPQIFSKGYNCIKVYEKQKNQKKTLRVSLQDSRIRWVYYFQKQVQNKFDEAYFDTNGIQGLLLFYIYQHRPEMIGLKVLAQVYPQIKVPLIKHSLSKLSQMTQKILIRTETQQDTYFQFNQLMKSKKRIIQYDGLVDDQQEQQHLFQKTQLLKQRQYAIDSNIAKLMKTKKILSLDILIDEVIKMIKVFTPGVRDVKASVERLIIKELLGRDEKDRNLIKYKQ